MKNAHERFGKLVYRRRTEKTATNLRVFLDAFVGEDRGKARLVSVVGGDVEIGALAAALANGDSLRQSALFPPRGLFGLAYWYSVLPFHAIVFKGMLSGIEREALKIATSPQNMVSESST